MRLSKLYPLVLIYAPAGSFAKNVHQTFSLRSALSFPAIHQLFFTYRDLKNDTLRYVQVISTTGRSILPCH